VLVEFDLVKHYLSQADREKPIETTKLYLNPAYIVSVALDVKQKANGNDICYLTMASRGDPEEGNDYYRVMGNAEDLKSYINSSCIGASAHA